jgi:hypothetical protein
VNLAGKREKPADKTVKSADKLEKLADNLQIPMRIQIKKAKSPMKWKKRTSSLENKS